MFDELMDMLDRDKREGSGRSGQQRGVRGMLRRLLGDEPDEGTPTNRHRYEDDDDFERRHGDRRPRRRQQDDFDLEA